MSCSGSQPYTLRSERLGTQPESQPVGDSLGCKTLGMSEELKERTMLRLLPHSVGSGIMKRCAQLLLGHGSTSMLDDFSEFI